jgi:uncharacterized protein YciI
MAYFVLLYSVVDDYAERRVLYRAAHLELAREANRRGELLMAGAFADPVDGALLVFQGPDRSVAERFAQRDPYVLRGLVTRWEVHAWTVVVGVEPATMEAPAPKPPAPTTPGER